jgi:hypothetical protein
VAWLLFFIHHIVMWPHKEGRIENGRVDLRTWDTRLLSVLSGYIRRRARKGDGITAGRSHGQPADGRPGHYEPANWRLADRAQRGLSPRAVTRPRTEQIHATQKRAPWLAPTLAARLQCLPSLEAALSRSRFQAASAGSL